MRKARTYDLGYYLLFGLDARLWRMVLELARVGPGQSVLDVGCGTGRLTLAAAGMVGPDGEACGIDAAPEMIQVAREKAVRAHSRATFEVGLIEDIPFEDGRFDTVVNTLVMHHLPDEVKSDGSREIWRVLKPGGLFLAVDLQLPSKGAVSSVARLFLSHHMEGSDIADSLGYLRDAGFTETESGPTSSSYFAYARGVKALPAPA